jgi:hypothetical protein
MGARLGMRYDIAVSFTENDAKVAAFIEAELRRKRLSVYYYKKENQVGEDLYKKTKKVYRNGTDYVLVIVSKDYPHGYWSMQEWKALLDGQRMRYVKTVFLVRVDKTPLHGLCGNPIYITWNNNPKEIAKLIREKIKGPTVWNVRLMMVIVILFLAVGGYLLLT